MPNEVAAIPRCITFLRARSVCRQKPNSKTEENWSALELSVSFRDDLNW